MKRRVVGMLAASWTAAGCGAAVQQPGAPAAIVMHVDAAGLNRPGYAAGAALGFEASRCCSVGAYATYWKLVGKGRLTHDESSAAKDKNDDDPPVDRILDGGLELGAVSPWITDRLRLRLRAGLAGTPPRKITLGRKGFAGSISVLYRLSDALPPDVGSATPVFDLVLGFQSWTFESERTPSGSDDRSRSGVAVVLGLRFGAAYGLALQ